MTIRIASLTILWVALYGEVSVGNVLGGLVVAALVTVMFPSTRGSVRRIRPWGAARLAGHVLVNLLTSTWQVAMAVVFPRPERVETSVREVRVSMHSATALTLMGNLITLTPGTMTVDVDEAAGLLHVHVLGRVDEKQFERSMARLEARVSAALVIGGAPWTS